MKRYSLWVKCLVFFLAVVTLLGVAVSALGILFAESQSMYVQDDYEQWIHENYRDRADIIAEHVMKSSCVIAFLSRNAMASDYCQEEIFFALEEHRPIVPVYLEEIMLPPGLRMRMNIRQAIHRNRFHTNADFLAKLTSEAYVKPSLSVQVQTVVPRQPVTPADNIDDLDLLFDLVSSMPQEFKLEPTIEYHDELLIPAVDIVLECQVAYISLLQRRLKIGFTRSARLMDEMEELRFVSPYNGPKPREVWITPTQWESTKKRMKLVDHE